MRVILREYFLILNEHFEPQVQLGSQNPWRDIPIVMLSFFRKVSSFRTMGFRRGFEKETAECRYVYNNDTIKGKKLMNI